MTMRLPKITVVTPSFNQGNYLKDTLDSVLSQQYPKLEYIVIDGGSSDCSVDILKEYDAELSYWVSEKDRGQSHAINKGFAKASGDILCWLNSDDQFAPDALWHAAIAFITSKADVVAGICEVYEDASLIHRHMTSCSNDGPLPLNDILDLDNGWNAGQFFYQPEVFFLRDIWIKAGAHVREDCFYSMDYELWCRFAFHKALLHTIGTPLVHFRQHKEQKTADPDAFKKELVTVRDAFCREYNIEVSGSERPKVNWGKKIKVALVNNLGFLYGAGIAQKRIASAFELAGHEVNSFDLSSQKNEPITSVVDEVTSYNPDIIIFGNLHDNDSVPVTLIDKLSSLYRCYWVTHDFWLITGRCGYFESCKKYLSGCDSACPTANIYPALEPDKINNAWQAKRDLLRNTENFTLLSNSQWSAKIFAETTSLPIKPIRLGVPGYIYKPMDTEHCRASLGISQNAFVLFFSVSSLSDPRKGGDILVRALEYLDIPDLVLLTVGRLDVPLEISGAVVKSLGYVDDTKIIVEAMNAADLYIGPSVEETLGQVFIEAAMCGLPSVGFNTAGVRDAIAQNITGIKVDKICPVALSSVIERLHDSSETLFNLKRLCRVYALNEFSLERSFASFFSVLREQGVVDELGVAHKIAFAKTSKIIDNEFVDPTAIQRVVKLFRKTCVFFIDLLPLQLRAKIVRLLPDWLSRFLIKVLY